jgi:septum formation protein
MRLVLASASPRRLELMRAAGFEFDVCPVDVDERAEPGESAVDYVRRLAVDKSSAGARLIPGAVVIGADTAVVINDEIFGKPDDIVAARRMLLRLSGRTHTVLTGVAVHDGVRATTHVEQTDVDMAALGGADLEWYLNTGEWHDKAGAYAIQGFASRFVVKIRGSYSNVVGMPIAQLYAMLKQLDVDVHPLR